MYYKIIHYIYIVVKYVFYLQNYVHFTSILCNCQWYFHVELFSIVLGVVRVPLSYIYVRTDFCCAKSRKRSHVPLTYFLFRQGTHREVCLGLVSLCLPCHQLCAADFQFLLALVVLQASEAISCCKASLEFQLQS